MAFSGGSLVWMPVSEMKNTQQNKILVVDDDRKLCGLIRDYLVPLGYEIAMEHTGSAGLQAAKTGCHDAILLDVMMPEMDGFEVLWRVRSVAPEIEVLVITGVKESEQEFPGNVRHTQANLGAKKKHPLMLLAMRKLSVNLSHLRDF